MMQSTCGGGGAQMYCEMRGSSWGRVGVAMIAEPLEFTWSCWLLFSAKPATVRTAGVKKSKSYFQKFWYHGIVCYYFVYNSVGKLKSYHVSLLRYGSPDLHFLGTLKNKLHICQKYDPSHHEFEV